MQTRKIRCDPQPGGCLPCIQNNTECRTTDRITGHARSRGHTENLEGENANLRAHIESLQRQLKEKGIDPVRAPAASGNAPGVTDNNHASALNQPTGDNTPLQTSQGTLLTEFRTGCIGDNYLGVSSGNSWLTPIEGTSLSLFGATLDLARFVPEDRDDSGTSYHNFLSKVFTVRLEEAPPLPPWETAKQHAEWYFRSIQPMLPILHKPNFMEVLHRAYHKRYPLTAPETVMVHMVMSLVSFQYQTRNSTQPQRVHTFQHWHYSLSLVPSLILGHTLADMQALALICAQLRAFPRPGACWMFTNTVIGVAIELGLHRSVTAWQGTTAQQDPGTIELRKRIFWSLLLMHIPLSGKLGRPMPIRLEDIDIEIPEEAHDYLPEESHFEEWRKCSFRSAKWNFVLLKVQMKVYSTIYSIGSNNSSYDANVRQLEKELKDVVNRFPPELSCGPETKEEDRVCALYLQLQATGCQLLIHHPALCRSLSQQVMSDNLDACLDASNKMLSIAIQLKTLNSLDSTIYWNMDFLASMFTMLFAHHERRDRLSAADLHRLRNAMKGWLDVMGFVGNLLGTGDRLHAALCNLVEWSIGNLSRHLAQKAATAAVASTATPPATETQPQQSQPQSQKHTPVYENGHDYNNGYTNGGAQDQIAARPARQVQVQPRQSAQQHVQHPQPQLQPHQQQRQPSHPSQALTPATDNGYSNGQAYSYPDAQGSNVPSFAPVVVPAYNTQGYAGEGVKTNIDTQLAAHAAMAQQVSQPTASNYMAMYQTPTAAYPLVDTVGPIAWKNFAEDMVSGMHTSAPSMSDASLASYAGMMAEPLANTPPKSGPFMYMNGASFGQMQMPPQDGNDIPNWPLIQY